MTVPETPQTAPDSKRARIFTPTRIVALAFICLTGLGLAYLHVAGGDDRISVPSGAKAGQLKLHPCHYATENGSYAADCGTLVVRENRHDPKSRLIALPVKRIRARFANPGASIFRLQGGPGITNMSFPDASRFADKHDVVLVGYRGVDGSSRLDCPEVTSAREQARDLLSAASYRADASAFRACARRLQDDGVDLAGYSLPERVDDLDAARRLLRGRADAGRADPPLCRAESNAGPHGFAPLGVPEHPRPLLVPADQEGQRQGGRVLRPDERDDRRWRTAQRAA